ncbi:hypothetical protein CPTAKMECS_098 [Salmonella phage vB_SenS-AKM_ECS]|uniref:Uncharacterized protein n=1 Tax=Salmonella phage vB_SenS-AKM_HA2021_32 TaxID=3158841 RepID=A0AAU7L2E1_9CAUD|nr:hypothetical protein CPTAKMECS_098 [Salmonella phage vB_SenS-AKM_ECS]
MDIYTTPAVNLIGSCLVHFRFFQTDDSKEEYTYPLMDFQIEDFFREVRNISENFYFGMDKEDFDIEFPIISRYFLEQSDARFDKIEHMEVAWAIQFEITGFARYIQGYEL